MRGPLSDTVCCLACNVFVGFFYYPKGFRSSCELSCAVSCAMGWERQGNRCYYLSKTAQSWFEAQNFCQRNGGNLASVTDEESHNFIKGKEVSAWIGGLSEPGNETWVWADCSPWSYTRWGSGEPKKWVDKEKCAAYIPHIQKWAVELCTSKRRILCSRAVCSGYI